MKPKQVKIFAAVLAALLAALLILPFILDIFIQSQAANTASAASTVSGLNSKLSQLDKKMKKIKQEIKKIESKKKATINDKEVLDNQIDVTQQQVSTINQLVGELNIKVSQCNEKLNTAKADEAKQYKQFLKRVRIMEEEGNASFLGIILSADSFSDLLTRAEIVGDVVSYDKKLCNQLENTRKSIEDTIQELKSSQDEKKQAQNNLVQKQNDLQYQYNQADQLIKELESDSESYKKAYEAAENAERETKARLKSLLKKKSSKSHTFIGGIFTWPTPSCHLITSDYGMRFDPIYKRNKKHTGIDIGAKRGAAIVAANSGTVIDAGYSKIGYGNYVVVDHGGGVTTLYAHMSKILASEGKNVDKGEKIGLVGSTGNSTGPHLHFEVLINGDDVNPMKYFS